MNIKAFGFLFVVSVISMLLVEFVVGSLFYRDFISSPATKYSPNMQDFLAYILGSSFVFTYFFLAEYSKKDLQWFGLKYGLIVSLSVFVYSFFLTLNTLTYDFALALVWLLDYSLMGYVSNSVVKWVL